MTRYQKLDKPVLVFGALLVLLINIVDWVRGRR